MGVEAKRTRRVPTIVVASSQKNLNLMPASVDIIHFESDNDPVQRVNIIAGGEIIESFIPDVPTLHSHGTSITTVIAAILLVIWLCWPEITNYKSVYLFVFIGVASILWISVAGVLFFSPDGHGGLPLFRRRFGIVTWRNLTASSQLPMTVVLVEAVLLAFMQPAIFANWHLYLVMGLYSLWAYIQQFWCQSIVAANVFEIMDTWCCHANMAHWKVRALASVLSGLFFGLGHVRSDKRLIAVTFLLGPVWSWLFLQYRQLLPLALAHGMGGAMLYFGVLGQDPL